MQRRLDELDRLADLARDGVGRPADLAEAYAWADVAAERGYPMFLAERDGRVVGILRCAESMASPLLDPARYAYISSVFVDREHRRSGVLRALLDAAERWCGERGLTDMRLHSVSGDEVSEGAWEHLGFLPVETVRMKRL